MTDSIVFIDPDAAISLWDYEQAFGGGIYNCGGAITYSEYLPLTDSRDFGAGMDAITDGPSNTALLPHLEQQPIRASGADAAVADLILTHDGQDFG
jgi:hypothetical protein